MRLSDGVEWAIHCATVLAGLPAESVLAAKDLATFHGVSESYLLKHLKALVKAGILESVPGPNGGFRLARSAESITLLDVVEAIEGPFTPFRCTEIRQRNPSSDPAREYRAPCHIHAAMREAEIAYRKVLRSKTVALMAQEVRENVPACSVEATGRWLGERVRTSRNGQSTS